MSQPRPGVVSRNEAVDILREIFSRDTSFADSLKEEQDEYFDIEMLMHKDAPGQLWHAYFVLSLRKILKELPASTAGLRKAVHELAYGHGNAAKGNPALPAASSASPATLSATPRTDVNNNNKKTDVNNNKKTDANTNNNKADVNNNKKADVNNSKTDVNTNKKTDFHTNKKRAATDQDVTQATKETKRVKTEAETPSFTVHAKGPYTVRVFEGDIPSAEFSSSTPATVRVKMVPGSAASAAAVVNCDESDN